MSFDHQMFRFQAEFSMIFQGSLKHKFTLHKVLYYQSMIVLQFQVKMCEFLEYQK